MSAPRKLKGWGDARRSPARRFSFQDDSGAFITEGRRWIDHCYRLIHPGGRTVFVAEPYEIDPEALDDLATLAGEGWDVTIRADRAEHYPGHTIWIGIQRERSTIIPMSDIETVPPPVCPLCCEQMHYMGGTQKREDEAAGRSDAGWRCPACGELGEGI